MSKGLTFKFVLLFSVSSAFAWEVDFTRRKRSQPTELPAKAPAQAVETAPKADQIQRQPEAVEARPEPVQTLAPIQQMAPNPTDSMVGTPPEPTVSENPRLKNLIATKRHISGDRQAFVILNTEKGFVPNNVRIYKGGRYTIHLVNINEQNKNVSFMLDAFSQNHSTYFGKIKSFELDPEKEGVYKFICPETSAEGKIVVFGSPQNQGAVINRRLSSGE